MKIKNGFTLIELLAVIVILAIIALIATPIVLNIIKDSKDSATLQSAQFYMDAVENAVAQKIMDEPTFRPTTCEIQSDGNLDCKGTLVEVEIKGEKPTSGTITLETGKIKDVEMVLSEKTITKNTEGKLVYEDESSRIIFDADVTLTPTALGSRVYALNKCIDESKIKKNSRYKITISYADNSEEIYEVTSSFGKVYESDGFSLGDKSKIAYAYLGGNTCGIGPIDEKLSLEGVRHVKVEYVDEEVYAHVLKVFNTSIEIFSTELIEGDAILEVKDSDGNVINLNVKVGSDSGYRRIWAYRDDYLSDSNAFESFNKNYQSVQQGKNITVTIKQGNNSYVLGGTKFEPNLLYDCSGRDYYYWGNNKLGYLTGC